MFCKFVWSWSNGVFLPLFVPIVSDGLVGVPEFSGLVCLHSGFLAQYFLAVG